jgi:hypothetical protein
MTKPHKIQTNTKSVFIVRHTNNKHTIAAKVMSSNPAHVIKFVSDLRQVGVSSTNKTDCHNITDYQLSDILLNVASNTITLSGPSTLVSSALWVCPIVQFSKSTRPLFWKFFPLWDWSSCPLLKKQLSNSNYS